MWDRNFVLLSLPDEKLEFAKRVQITLEMLVNAGLKSQQSLAICIN